MLNSKNKRQNKMLFIFSMLATVIHSTSILAVALIINPHISKSKWVKKKNLNKRVQIN